MAKGVTRVKGRFTQEAEATDAVTDDDESLGTGEDPAAVEDEGLPTGERSEGEDGSEEGTERGEEERLPRDREMQKLKNKKKLEKLNAKAENRGIIYISRIPPHMKPQKIRQLLSPFGDLGRLYLAPEDPSLRKKRKQKGGNTGKEFTEGWVEFEHKKIAKQVARMLNGQQMDPKRKSAFHYDLWAIKYLPKFKWHHLTEDIAYQKAVREQKMAFEITNAKRERDFFLKQVAQGKAISAMQERKRKRAEGSGEGAVDAGEAEGNGTRRDFRQRTAKPDPVQDDGPALSKKTLSLIGGKTKKQKQAT